MEMANQMLSEIKAANKRKTLDGTSTSTTTNSKLNRLSKHDDDTLADHMSQISVNNQKPLPNPHLVQQQKQQQQHVSQTQTPPTNQQVPSSPVGRVQPSLPPVLPAHNQPYQPQQYPIQSNDPRYQPQQHQQQFDPRYQQPGRNQVPYHTPSMDASPNMRPIYTQPTSQSQMDVNMSRVSNYILYYLISCVADVSTIASNKTSTTKRC